MTMKTDKPQEIYNIEMILARLRHAAAIGDWDLVEKQIEQLERLFPELARFLYRTE